MGGKEIEFLTTKEVAELLKVSRVTVFTYIKQGKLKKYRVEGGRINKYKKSEVIALLEEVNGK